MKLKTFFILCDTTPTLKTPPRLLLAFQVSAQATSHTEQQQQQSCHEAVSKQTTNNVESRVNMNGRHARNVTSMHRRRHLSVSTAGPQCWQMPSKCTDNRSAHVKVNLFVRNHAYGISASYSKKSIVSGQAGPTTMCTGQAIVRVRVVRPSVCHKRISPVTIKLEQEIGVPVQNMPSHSRPELRKYRFSPNLRHSRVSYRYVPSETILCFAQKQLF